MSLTFERRAEIIAALGEGLFNAAYRYPDECLAFASLADETALTLSAGGREFGLHIYKARGRAQGCPVHVNIHGGGWVYPRRLNDALYSAWLADAIGGVVADVDYTVSSDAPWPTAFEQCREAGRYVYTHCAEWGCDPARVSMGGYSAGGNLTAAAALSAVRTGEYPLCLMVIGYGPVDLTGTPSQRNPGQELFMSDERSAMFTELYLDGELSHASELSVSPGLASDDELAKLPRTVICTAGRCDFRFEDEEFGRRLASLGVEVTMRRFPQAVHGFIPHFTACWRQGAELIARSIRSA